MRGALSIRFQRRVRSIRRLTPLAASEPLQKPQAGQRFRELATRAPHRRMPHVQGQSGLSEFCSEDGTGICMLGRTIRPVLTMVNGQISRD